MEGHNIILREVDGLKQPGILTQIADAVEQLFPTAKETGRKWLWAKGETEVAKAAEIKARVITMLGQFELERERLVQERDAALAQAVTEKERETQAAREREYALKTERLKVVVDSLVRLKELDAPANLEVLAKKLLTAASEEVS
jgi:hypothetical protein